MAQYYSVIFTRRNSGLKRLEDLKGKIIVFEDPGSTSGYLMPKLFLQRHGLKLTEKARVDPNSAATDVGYIFADSQDRLVEAVLTQQSAAGAFSNDDLTALDDKKKNEVAQLSANRPIAAALGIGAERSRAGIGRKPRNDSALDA